MTGSRAGISMGQVLKEQRTGSRAGILNRTSFKGVEDGINGRYSK